jgi:hypothetical protein
MNRAPPPFPHLFSTRFAILWGNLGCYGVLWGFVWRQPVRMAGSGVGNAGEAENGARGGGRPLGGCQGCAHMDNGSPVSMPVTEKTVEKLASWPEKLGDFGLGACGPEKLAAEKWLWLVGLAVWRETGGFIGGFGGMERLAGLEFWIGLVAIIGLSWLVGMW